MAIIISFLTISAHGASLEIVDEAEEKIWINLNKVFRDVGIILWPNAYCCTLRIPDHPSSSGFCYVIPIRVKGAVGSLAMLREFNYLV